MDEIRAELRRHGKARARARANAAAHSQAIAELAPKALAAGLTKVEVCKLAQITRPALDTMLRDN
jgi:hypothetical protein